MTRLGTYSAITTWIRSNLNRILHLATGSAMFFVIKLVWVASFEAINAVEPWLSYLFITLLLTLLGWLYHSKITFRTPLSAYGLSRYLKASLGLKVFDYAIFVSLVYAAGLQPVLSVVIAAALLFALRYVAYNSYVFSDDGRDQQQRDTGLGHTLLAIALVIGSVNYLQFVDDRAPQKDGREYYCAAANLYTFGIFSADCRTTPKQAEELVPTMNREPGLSLLLAPTFVISATIDAPTKPDVRQCDASSSAPCKKLRSQQRQVLVLLFSALTILVYFVIQDLTSQPKLAGAGAILSAFGNGVIVHMNDFYSELPATILVLTFAWMLYRSSAAKQTITRPIGAGIALGLLALTKAVYFYLIPVLAVVAVVWSAAVRDRTIIFRGFIITLVASVLISPWLIRNSTYFDRPTVSGRDGNVMAIRAQFAEMSWRQYRTGYLYFTPLVGPELAKALGSASEDIKMFDRKNPEGFLQRYRRGEGGTGIPKGADQDELRHRSLHVFAENLPMQLALVPLMAYRGAFLPVGSYRLSEIPRERAGLALTTVSVATLLIIFLLPAFLLNFIYDVVNRNYAMVLFHSPVLYTIGIHAALTHYIPRYSLPLFGILVIELCLAARILWNYRNKSA